MSKARRDCNWNHAKPHCIGRGLFAGAFKAVPGGRLHGGGRSREGQQLVELVLAIRAGLAVFNVGAEGGVDELGDRTGEATDEIARTTKLASSSIRNGHGITS